MMLLYASQILVFLSLSSGLPPEAELLIDAGGTRFRVQALSDVILRLERPRPDGSWEDRDTLLVQRQRWDTSAALTKSVDPQQQEVSASTKALSVAFSWRDREVSVTITDVESKELLWRGDANFSSLPAGPFLPSPSQLPSLWAFRDAPRLVPPEWGPTPPPAGQSPPSNGFDVSSMAPDAYVFSPRIAGYSRFRSDFLKLTGPIAAIPDYALGNWFLWYHNYTQEEKEQEVLEFHKRRFPLDVTGLDMDWRKHPCTKFQYTPGCENFTHADEVRYEIAVGLLPDLPGFTRRMHELNVSILLNDHPMQQNASFTALSSEEIQFRWSGLTKLMEKGIDFWWFDCHWSSVLPGINCSEAGAASNPDRGAGFQCTKDGTGIDYVGWEKYVQFEVMERFNREHRPSNTRTMQLGCTNSNFLADHRYPVHWTGDNHYDSLHQAIVDVVEGGLQLKPYTHPDCTGHMKPPGQDYPAEVFIRWMQFCALSPIVRVHSSPPLGRQPWKFGAKAENISRSFLQMRMALMPTLLSAKRQVEMDGTPLARRLDLEFPEYSEAAKSDQYLLGPDLLVAPIDPWASGAHPPNFNRHRTLWIPPGAWEDAWSGEVIHGPVSKTVDSPLEAIPLYHRRPGLLVCASSQALSVRAQDRSHLVLMAFPGEAGEVERVVYDEEQNTSIRLSSPNPTRTQIEIDCNVGAQCTKAWTLRVHLLARHHVDAIIVNGIRLQPETGNFQRKARILHPSSTLQDPYVPAAFQAGGQASLAGPILEISLSAGYQLVAVQTSIADVSFV